MTLLYTLALSSLLFTLAQAQGPFFIIPHGPLLSSRLDSIVNPGDISSHQHAIIGASNFGPHYDYEENLKSSCVSGRISRDFSNYWMPDMYHKLPAGGWKHTGLSYANTYYFFDRKPKGAPVYEFPPGFRMMGGDANRNTFDDTDPAHIAVQYICLGVSGSPMTHDFPKQKCPDGVRAQIFMPHCWDGKHNWLEGSKHVAYPAEGAFDQGGACPSTHPHKVPQVFYEFIFHDNEAYTEGGRALANGDDLGYSLHADFVSGWPEGFFTEIASHGSTCNVQFALDKCPPLAALLQDSGKCQYTGTTVDEDVGDGASGVPQLPGNNPIWGRNGPRKPAADYVEAAQLINSQTGATVARDGPGKAYAAIAAGNLNLFTIAGEADVTAKPTTVKQQGVTQGGAQATQIEVTTSASAAPTTTASTASTGDSSSSSGTTTASQTSAAPSNIGADLAAPPPTTAPTTSSPAVSTGTATSTRCGRPHWNSRQ